MGIRRSTPAFLATFDLAELAHIQAPTDCHNLDRLREVWDPALCEPIDLYVMKDGALEISDGAHRLTLARERNEPIRATVWVSAVC